MVSDEFLGDPNAERLMQPAMVILELRRLGQRILNISPEMTPDICYHIMAELALFENTLDLIEKPIFNSSAYKLRQSTELSEMMENLKREAVARAENAMRRSDGETDRRTRRTG